MNTCIFDLDGTLLPMPDQELFLDTYFKALGTKFVPHGFDPKEFIKAVWVGTKAMIENDGTMTNRQRFWTVFASLMGDQAKQLEPMFDEFYRNEFTLAKKATQTHPYAKECIRLLKEKGYAIGLATNPLFPRVATHMRLGWAGLVPEDFDLITTYENSTYCKPKLEYYEEVLKNLGKEAKDCIMIGNDVKEDMCAAQLGMDTFLLTDCLICPEEEDSSIYRQGDFEELLSFISQLPDLNLYISK
jgi:FMN phosphatase YigB (HAD superfamily)